MEENKSQVITGYFYFLLKYMFHAGFVTFHNSQQKHNETSVEPPRGIVPHNIRQRGMFKSLSTRFCVCKFLVAL